MLNLIIAKKNFSNIFGHTSEFQKFWSHETNKMMKDKTGNMAVTYSTTLQESAPEVGLLNKRLMLCSSFRCDQIYKYGIYHFGHTLLCYLSQTWMFNEQASEVGLLNKRLMLCSSFRCDQIYKYGIYHFGHTLLFNLSRT